MRDTANKNRPTGRHSGEAHSHASFYFLGGGLCTVAAVVCGSA